MLSETLTEGLEAYRIGPKIRALRSEKDLGLAELGAHSGLSSGMLSKIERGQVFPTLPTLLRIALVFGVGLDHFFGPGENNPMLEITRAGRRVRLPNTPEGAISYLFESLDYAADRRDFDGFFADFSASGPIAPPHSHPGNELFVVLEGAVELHIHGKVHRLEKGDAVHFDSGYQHAYKVAGQHPARAIVITTRGALPGV
ncbi:MAG: XRE family transcriptional regulator [Maritimibacter sp.]